MRFVFKYIFIISCYLAIGYAVVLTWYKHKGIAYNKKYILLPVVMFLVGLIGYHASPVPLNSKENENVIEQSISENTDNKESPETTIEETVGVAETPEEFKESCQEIGYKKILRNPEEYIGQRIVITAKVQQIMQGGLFDDSQYYRVLTDNDGYEIYADDEYFMYDSRIGDDMKILKDDVLKIYAVFTGMEEVKRALTGTKEEVPAIKAYFVELISE